MIACVLTRLSRFLHTTADSITEKPIKPGHPESKHGFGYAQVRYCLPTPTERSPELKPNYSYEKRQRELEKKKKKAEKAHKNTAPTDMPPMPEAISPPDKI